MGCTPPIPARTRRRSSLPESSRSPPPSRPWRAGRGATWDREACKRKLPPRKLPWAPVATRKQWIAGTLRPAGAIVVDDGAVRALMGGKSLLPAGVTRAMGRFDRGDTVSIIGPDGSEVARGICAYSDGDAARIIGRKSADIEKVLGFRGRDEIVHRDDLVLIRAHVTGSL